MTRAGRPPARSTTSHVSRITIAGSRRGLEELADKYTRFAVRYDLPAGTRREMYLAIEEIVSNVVRHGSRGTRPRTISVRLELDRNSLAARIVDDGPEFDPFSVAAPALDRPLLERPIGGLGIALVGRLTDEHSYSRRAGRNHVVLRLRLRRGEKTRDD